MVEMQIVQLSESLLRDLRDKRGFVGACLTLSRFIELLGKGISDIGEVLRRLGELGVEVEVEGGFVTVSGSFGKLVLRVVAPGEDYIRAAGAFYIRGFSLAKEGGIPVLLGVSGGFSRELEGFVDTLGGSVVTAGFGPFCVSAVVFRGHVKGNPVEELKVSFERLGAVAVDGSLLKDILPFPNFLGDFVPDLVVRLAGRGALPLIEGVRESSSALKEAPGRGVYKVPGVGVLEIVG